MDGDVADEAWEERARAVLSASSGNVMNIVSQENRPDIKSAVICA